MLMATPGTTTVHQAACQTERVSCNIFPQLGCESSGALPIETAASLYWRLRMLSTEPRMMRAVVGVIIMAITRLTRKNDFALQAYALSRQAFMMWV